MEGLMFPATLLFIGAVALMFYKSNSMLLMGITLAIGVYVIYSHNTGVTLTDYKNEALEAIDEEAGYTKEKKGIGSYDPQKQIDSINP